MPDSDELISLDLHLTEENEIAIGSGDFLGIETKRNLEHLMHSDPYIQEEVRSRFTHNSNHLTLLIPKYIQRKKLAEYFNEASTSGQSFSLESRLVTYFQRNDFSTLRPFQIEGKNWLKEKNRAILADDMGLGKTVQALSAAAELISEFEVSRVLVVCPRSLIMNWINEALKWTPFLTVTCIIASSKTAESLWGKRIGKSQIIVTSYEQLRSYPEHMARQAQLVIADEAHKLRRNQSGISKSFKKLGSQRIWLLTGTPLERSLEDYVNLLAILDETKFSKKDIKDGEVALRSKARPFVMRRNKREVLKDLPELVEIHETLELKAEQRSSYKQTLKDSVENQLSRYQRLREICDFDPLTEESTKFDRIVDLIEEITQANEKLIVFSYWLKPLELLESRLKKAGLVNLVHLTGEDSITEREKKIFEFKRDKSILLASARVASEGLTLTEANHVIFVNRYWNPSNNNQAKDRILRIGQTKGTFCYTFTCNNTIEEAIDLILSRKVDSFDAAIEVINSKIIEEISQES